MDLAPLAVASVRRANRTFFDLTTQREPMSIGEARFPSGVATSAAAAFMTDVLLDVSGDATSGAADLAAVDAFFTARGVRCSRWIPAVEQSIDGLAAVLRGAGFERDDWTTAVLPTEAPLPDQPALRVLSGRAMPRAYREVLAERHGEGVAGESAIAAELEKLDSAQYEPFVAMIDERPAGVMGLYQTGEVGRLSDLFVSEAMRRRGVAAGLTATAIRTARRWGLRYICAQFSRNSASGPQIEGLLKRAGFCVGGTIPTLRLPEAGDGNW
ncbi:MAG: GNAT family N-acetyltransferase [Phycisphaerales bacterium]|nr:GNAT family N-acetyltransferase [Phycisphaerales bacterium]